LKIFTIIVFIFAELSCITLNDQVIFKYNLSLTDSKQTKFTLGIAKFKDFRDDSQKKSTEFFGDVEEKITAKILEDFKFSSSFKDVHYRCEDSEDFCMKGTIIAFNWKAEINPFAIIPILNLFIFFGMPIDSRHGVISLKVDIYKKNTFVKSFQRKFEKKTLNGLYYAKAGDPGAELAEAFRETVKLLKNDIGEIIK